MRYGIISDVHANLEALTAVLGVLDRMQVGRVVCLGDLVGYYANPNECLALIQERGITCVRGNHDSVAAGLREPREFSPTAIRVIAWTRQQLTLANLQYLRALPLQETIDGRFGMVHGALHPEPNDELRICNEADAWPTLEAIPKYYPGTDLLFFGHTHHRTAYGLREGRISRLAGDVLHLEEGGLYLVNPGSVGQSRDEDPRASFAVYDAKTRTVTFHRIAYDRYATRAQAMEEGLLPRPALIRRSASWLKHRVFSLP